MTQTHRYLNDNRQFVGLVPAIAESQAKTVSHAYFDSPNDMATYLKSVPTSEWYCDKYIGPQEFTDGIDLQGALKMERDGWKDGAGRANQIAGSIRVSMPAKRRVSTIGMAGAYPHIPRYLAGVPEHMTRPAMVRGRPVLTLVNHMGGKSGVPSQCFINRAAVIAAIVDAIEAAGYSLHLVGVSFSEEGSFAHETAVTIKEPGRHLDLSSVAYALGHVAFFRQLVFGVRFADAFNKPLTSGLGKTQDYLTNQVTSGIYVLPSMNETHRSFLTEKGAKTDGLELMIAKLREQECPAFT